MEISFMLYCAIVGDIVYVVYIPVLNCQINQFKEKKNTKHL